MSKGTPIACSLGASNLQQRLSEIAEVGASSLIEHHTDDDRHLLRFRATESVRGRLETIGGGEVECCPFLDLSLETRPDELILTIGPPEDGQEIADALAAAFGNPTGARTDAPTTITPQG